MPILAGEPPSVTELLDVDREYRQKAAAGELQRIAPRRFNPSREAWLPILHTKRGNRRYTALFSNTARAHRTGHARDWVVIYGDNGSGEHRHTVITAAYGSLRGRRVIAGREDECRAAYTRVPTRSKPRASTRHGAPAHDLLSASDDATPVSQRMTT
jgi:putative hydrolase